MLRREQVAREHKEVRVLADLNGSLVGLDEIPSVPCANLIIHLFLSLSRGVARISTPPLSLPACFRDGTGLLYPDDHPQPLQDRFAKGPAGHDGFR